MWLLFWTDEPDTPAAASEADTENITVVDEESSRHLQESAPHHTGVKVPG